MGCLLILYSVCCCCSCLQACLPASGSLDALQARPGDVSECEAAAWQLQVHACALHILLLELLSVQVGV
jgi:hypothetical protein